MGPHEREQRQRDHDGGSDQRHGQQALGQPGERTAGEIDPEENGDKCDLWRQEPVASCAEKRRCLHRSWHCCGPGRRRRFPSGGRRRAQRACCPLPGRGPRSPLVLPMERRRACRRGPCRWHCKHTGDACSRPPVVRPPYQGPTKRPSGNRPPSPDNCPTIAAPPRVATPCRGARRSARQRSGRFRRSQGGASRPRKVSR